LCPDGAAQAGAELLHSVRILERHAVEIGDSHVGQDRKAGTDRLLRLSQTARLHMARGEDEMADIPARHPVDRPRRPLRRRIEAPGHVMGKRNAAESEEDAGIARVGADRDLLVGNRLVAAPDKTERRAKAAIGERAIRVKLDRTLKGDDGLVMLVQSPAADAKGPVGVFVARVELCRAAAKLIRLGDRRAGVIGIAHQRGMMLDQREHHRRLGAFRIEREGAVQETAGRLETLGGEVIEQVPGPHGQFPHRQIGSGGALDRLFDGGQMHAGLDRGHDIAGDLVLQIKDIRQMTVVAL